MRHGKRHRLTHSRISQQHFVNFARRNFFTTAIAEFPQPVSDEKVTFPVEITLVPRPKPAAGERHGVGLRMTRVSRVTLAPRIAPLPVPPAASALPASSRVATAGPAARPTARG